jgi:hypothetical protein
MKTRTKTIVGVFLTLIVAVIVVVFAFPQVAATRKIYFDTNSGRLKVQCVGFGRIYHESVEETEYSKLLKEFGFEDESADWKPAFSRELGIRRFFHPQNVSYPYGRVRARLKEFTMWLELQEKADAREKREQLAKCRALVREGSPEQIQEYVSSLLQQNAASK